MQNQDLGKIGVTLGGEWNSNISYEKLTIITKNGKVYISKFDNINTDPENDTAQTNWLFLVRNGQDGQDGKDGIDGKNGQDGRDGRDGRDGINGQDGKDGQNGQDGKDGAPGESAFEAVKKAGYVGTEEEFNNTLKEILEHGAGEGNIENNYINTPDEEDLTSDDDKLKFKDRTYADNYGMGYVIARRSMDIKSQITSQKTIYEIRYDFDLNGGTITLPENCAIHFMGGCFKNGNVILNNTQILGTYNGFDTSVKISGSIANECIYTGWWKYNGTDYYQQFKQMVDVANSSKKPIFFTKGEYIFLNDNTTVRLTQSIDFNNSTIILDTNNHEQFIIYYQNSESKEVNSSYFNDIKNAINNKDRKCDAYSAFKNSMLLVYSSDVEIKRNHELVKTPLYRRENIYIDANGFCPIEYFLDIDNINSIKSIDCSVQSYFKNLILKINDTFTGNQTVEYRRIGFYFQYNANLTIDNIIFPDPNIDYYRCVYFSDEYGYNHVFKNMILSNTRKNRDTAINSDYSSYTLMINTLINVTLDNVRIGDPTEDRWTQTGANYITNVHVKNCILTNIDSHYRTNNLLVEDSIIGRNIGISGKGKLEIYRTKFLTKANTGMISRGSGYGNWFYGDIILKDCVIDSLGNVNTNSLYLMTATYTEFDYQVTNETLKEYMKYSFSKNIIIDNLKFERYCPDMRLYMGIFTSDVPYSHKVIKPNVTIKNTTFPSDFMLLHEINFNCNNIYDAAYESTIKYINCKFHKDYRFWFTIANSSSTTSRDWNSYKRLSDDVLPKVNIVLDNCSDINANICGKNGNVNIYNSNILNFQKYSNSLFTFNLYNCYYEFYDLSKDINQDSIPYINFFNCIFDIRQDILNITSDSDIKEKFGLSVEFRAFENVAKWRLYNCIFGENIRKKLNFKYSKIHNRNSEVNSSDTYSFSSSFTLENVLNQGYTTLRGFNGNDITINVGNLSKYNNRIIKILLQNSGNIKFNFTDSSYPVYGFITNNDNTIPPRMLGKTVYIVPSLNNVLFLVDDIMSRLYAMSEDNKYMNGQTFYDTGKNCITAWNEGIQINCDGTDTTKEIII